MSDPNNIKINETIVNKPKIRESSIELLRIISMLFIIASHFCLHGEMTESENTFNKIVMTIFDFGGKFGVDCFVLISGYCLIKSKFSYKKLFKLILEVLFYSLLIYAIFLGLGIIEFTDLSFEMSLIPSTKGLYWFVSAYLVLYILSPFICKMLKNLSQREHLCLIVVGFTMFLISKYIDHLPANSLWFGLLFILAAYFRLYPSKFSTCKPLLLSLFIIGFATSVTLHFFNIRDTFDMSSPLMTFCSLTATLFFTTLKFKCRIINILASTSFATYLIHDNPHVRAVVWKDFFKTTIYLNSHFLIFYGIGVVITVYILCFIIEMTKRITIDKPLCILACKIKTKVVERKKSPQQIEKVNAGDSNVI